ncbi:Hha/YmoA family nucleoid-associated regulatory protein [Escherichia coli]
MLNQSSSTVCSLEKVISTCVISLLQRRWKPFNSAVDHRLAELTMNKLYDCVPASVWKYVT